MLRGQVNTARDRELLVENRGDYLTQTLEHTILGGLVLDVPVQALVHHLSCIIYRNGLCSEVRGEKYKTQGEKLTVCTKVGLWVYRGSG